MAGKRLYKLNENCFEEMSPECAYWVGFIAADGCISDVYNRTNLERLVITITKSDSEHLLKLQEFMKSTHPLYESGNNGKTLQVCNRNVCGDLKKWGIKPRKSKLNYSFLDYIPEGYKDYFICGYFDGDGSIFLRDRWVKWKDKKYRYKYWHIKFISNYKTIENIKNHLVNSHGLSRRPSIQGFKNTKYAFACCWVSQKDVKKFSEIYYRSPVKLDRKYVKFQEMTKM